MVEKSNFSEFLIAKRAEMNLTRNELASLAGITSVQIKNLEEAKCFPRSSTLYAICKALKLDFEEVYNKFSLSA